MNKLRFALGALFIATLFSTSCKKAVDTSSTSQYIGTWNGTTSCGEGLGGWQSKASFLGAGRKGATSFSITNIATSTIYVAAGDARKDFWSYNPKLNAWTHLANIPGVTHYRTYGSSFAIDDRGYLSCGADSGYYKNDLWAYDPNTDTWTQKAGFPGKGRIKAMTFVVDGIAYLGGGIDTGGVALSDFWAYNPTNNVWTQKTNLPRATSGAFAFNINSHGYISCGFQNGVQDTATFDYNPVTNAWTRVAGFPGYPRHGGAAFTLNNQGYCGFGGNGSVAYDDIFYYNAGSNKWTKFGNLVGKYNTEPMCGTAYGKGYVGIGGAVDSVYYNYWYELTPPSNSASFTISAGANNFSVNMNYIIGKDSCAHEVTLTGTVSSNASGRETFSIATHNVVDRCGKNYAITGSGAINGDVITITTVSSSAGGTSACTFTGKR